MQFFTVKVSLMLNFVQFIGHRALDQPIRKYCRKNNRVLGLSSKLHIQKYNQF